MNLQKYFAASARKVAPMRASLEDLDSGAIQMAPPITIVRPTPDIAADVTRTYAELEAKQSADVEHSARSVATGIADLAEAVQDANDTDGGISTESAFFLSVAAESLFSRLGQDEVPFTKGIENIDPDVMRRVDPSHLNSMVKALEAWSDERENAVGLEGVDKPLKEFAKRGFASIVRSSAPVWAAAKLTKARLSGVVQKATHVKAKSGAKIRIRAKDIALGASYSKDLARDFKSAADYLGYLVNGFASDAIEAYANNSKNMDRCFEDHDVTEDQETKAFLAASKKLLSMWEDPRKKIKYDLTAPVIGNHVLFTNYSDKYRGDQPVFKEFDKLANHDYPRLMVFNHDKTSANKDRAFVEVAALTPEQIVATGRVLEHALDSISAVNVLIEKVKSYFTVASAANVAALTVASMGAAPVTFAVFYSILITKAFRRAGQLDKNPGSEILSGGARAIYDAYVTSSRLRFHVHHDAIIALCSVANAFRKVAILSLKAHQSPSNEAYDEACALVGYTTHESSPNEPQMVPDADSSKPLPSKPGTDSNINQEPWTVQTVEPEDGVELTDVGTESVEGRQSVPYWMLQS